jgi:hypothetical protein
MAKLNGGFYNVLRIVIILQVWQNCLDRNTSYVLSGVIKQIFYYNHMYCKTITTAYHHHSKLYYNVHR